MEVLHRAPELQCTHPVLTLSRGLPPDRLMHRNIPARVQCPSAAHPRQRQPSLHTLTATIPAWAPVPPRPGGHSVPPVPGAALAPDHAALTVQGAGRAGVPMLWGGHTGHPAEPCLPGRGRGGSAGVWGVREGGCEVLISSAPGSCGEFQEPRWAPCPVPKFLCCRHPAAAGPVPGGCPWPRPVGLSDAPTCPHTHVPMHQRARASIHQHGGVAVQPQTLLQALSAPP